jgi:hypothetical protein
VNFKVFVQLILLITLPLSSFGGGEWLYYKHYPWVYDNLTKDWLYLTGSDGKVWAYRSGTKEWEEFKVYENDWDEMYELWSQNPAPYGGINSLKEIKLAKENNATFLNLAHNITDLTPLSYLTTLTKLQLGEVSHNRFSDLSPLSKLKNLTELFLRNNQVSSYDSISNLTNLEDLRLGLDNCKDISPLASLTKLRILSKSGDITKTPTERFSDLSPLSNLDNLEEVYFSHLPISDISPLANHTKLKVVWFQICMIADLSPLEKLKNIEELILIDNSVSDISSLLNLTNLKMVSFYNSTISYNLLGTGNSVANSDRTLLEQALPQTKIVW